MINRPFKCPHQNLNMIYFGNSLGEDMTVGSEYFFFKMSRTNQIDKV
jgi:hypothetical protein